MSPSCTLHWFPSLFLPLPSLSFSFPLPTLYFTFPPAKVLPNPGFCWPSTESYPRSTYMYLETGHLSLMMKIIISLVVPHYTIRHSLSSEYNLNSPPAVNTYWWSTVYTSLYPTCLLSTCEALLNPCKPPPVMSSVRPLSDGHSIHFFTKSLSSFLCRRTNHLELFVCNTDLILSISSLSRNSADGTLFCCN